MSTIINFRYRPLLLTGALVALLTASGCNNLTDIEPVSDPNSASLESIINPSQPQINALAVGVEGSLRLGHANNSSSNRILGTLGREVTVQATTESRWYYSRVGRAPATRRFLYSTTPPSTTGSTRTSPAWAGPPVFSGPRPPAAPCSTPPRKKGLTASLAPTRP